MSKKLGRNYRLTWSSLELAESIIIENPFTVEFTVTRSTMASLNSCQIRLYNLNKQTRSKIFQDRFDINNNNKRKIVFQAGYNTLSTLFIGDVYMADSYRQGNNIITFIEARDGGFDIGGTLTNQTVKKDTTFNDILEGLVTGFPDLKKGVFGNIEGSVKRPIVLDDNSFTLIKKYSNNKAFVDLGKVNILNDDEVIKGYVLLVNSETGLISTPRRSNTFLEIETLFEPRVIMGQLLEIESSVQPDFDGQYKVIGVNHSGTISEAVSGNCTSKFSLLIGSKIVGGFKEVG